VIEADKAEFGTQLTHFGAVHKFSVTPTVLRTWWEDLCDMDLTDFRRACKELRKTAPWFPKPHEFRKASRKGWM
jgi:hypothetical protein